MLLLTCMCRKRFCVSKMQQISVCEAENYVSLYIHSEADFAALWKYGCQVSRFEGSRVLPPSLSRQEEELNLRVRNQKKGAKLFSMG